MAYMGAVKIMLLRSPSSADGYLNVTSNSLNSITVQYFASTGSTVREIYVLVQWQRRGFFLRPASLKPADLHIVWTTIKTSASSLIVYT